MAFVTGVGVGVGVQSRTSSFNGTPTVERSVSGAAARAPTAPARVTMRVLDGLDVVSQQPYTFSRYILGPFQGTTITPNSSETERAEAIAVIYRQVFANAYIMEEERAEVAIAESQFKLGALSVREFVRCLAKSNAYRTRFFEGASNYRFIEMNFMHLLGRAPDGFADMRAHNATLQNEGYDAEIDLYLDSEEYDTVFGEDTVPFLRFRGAYTPCDSFNKQCALKGGWANSDKAMGGAALSGYNGSDGRQMSTLISSHIAGVPVDPFTVAANTPLKSTAPNWYAAPDPAVAPEPAFVSEAEVVALQKRVAALQAQYDAQLERKNNGGKDPLAMFRKMTKELGIELDRGFAYDGGDPTLGNPYARKFGADDSLLSLGGQKSSDYKRFGANLEIDTLSRTERDLEDAKAELRVLEKALAKSTPMTKSVLLPGSVVAPVATVVMTKGIARPRITATKKVKTSTAPVPAAAATEAKSGPLGALPELPSLDGLKKLLPF